MHSFKLRGVQPFDLRANSVAHAPHVVLRPLINRWLQYFSSLDLSRFCYISSQHEFQPVRLECAAWQSLFSMLLHYFVVPWLARGWATVCQLPGRGIHASSTLASLELEGRRIS